MLTLDRLKQLLSYSPTTGQWIWLRAHRKIKPGDRAGAKDAGYWRIKVDGKSYKASRLACFYMTGEWPPGDVDHKNLDRGDDRWENIRPATRSQNRANTRPEVRNTSGYKGVSFSKQHKKWRVNLKKDGRTIFIGLFSTKEEGACAYATAAKAHFGAFARVG